MTKEKITVYKEATTYTKEEVEIEFPLYLDITDYDDRGHGHSYVMIDESFRAIEVSYCTTMCTYYDINTIQHVYFPKEYVDYIDCVIDKSAWDEVCNNAILYINEVINNDNN